MNKKPRQRNLLKPSQKHQSLLKTNLKQGLQSNLDSTKKMGNPIFDANAPILDLTTLHKNILITELLSNNTASKYNTAAHFKKTTEALKLITKDLAASNRALHREVIQRKIIQEDLKKSKAHYAQILKQSIDQQKQLKLLSRQIILTQENERKNISRELHDVILQTLLGINIRLATLKANVTVDAKRLDRDIASTQRLVKKSVNIVHTFARKLRPAALDDLGLIPALNSFMKIFSARTRIATHLKSFEDVEKLSEIHRTVLFRVAQEALKNTSRHAQATQVNINISLQNDSICMKIKDDGKSFQVQKVLTARGGKCLGLLGMKERLEMVGGTFMIESSPGNGTIITACIPFKNSRKKTK